MLRFLTGAIGRKVSSRSVGSLICRENSGSAAVEFALVAVPFIALLTAVLEVAMFFLGNLLLEHAVNESSRLIRTGQAHQSGFSEEQFKSKVCSYVVALFDCESGLKILVTSYDTFSEVEAADPIDEDGQLKSSFEFDIGGAEDIILVRAFYEWDGLTIFPNLSLSLDLSNMASGNTLVSASTTFRNEPFGGS